MSKKQADVKSVRENAKAGINCFPKTKLKNQLDKLATARASVEGATVDGDSVSMNIVELAEDYATQAALITTDVTTVLNDWRVNMQSLTMELAVAGHKFAKLTPAKDDKAATACLTGTGNNVMSIAKGVIDFGICMDLLAGTVETDLSYRDVRTKVQGLRAERKALANPEAAALAIAEQLCRDNFAELCDAVFSQKDIQLTQSLATALAEQTAEQIEAVERVQEIDAEAAALAAAA